jgi:hypothetical protein
MYPRNSATPNQLAIGPVVQISDGAVQTSGCTVRILPFGGAEGDGAGTTAYSTDGVVLYTPSQAETNYTSFVLIAKKTGCIPASITIVTSASATPGTALLAPTTHTSAVVPTVTTVSNAVSVNTGTTTAVVSHDGNNATSGATLKSVAEAATAGSTLLVGPGTFALGNAAINANITLIGAGDNRTIITSTAITGDVGAILNVAEVRHLRVTPVGTATDGQIAWGVRELSSQTVWPRYRAADCWFDGDLDGAFFQMEFATTTAELERCRIHAKYDAVRWGVESSASTLYLRDCDLSAIGPAAAGATSRGIASTGGTVYVTGGRIHAAGSATFNSAIYNTATMHLAGVTLTSAGTAAKDIETALAGATSVTACAYDTSKTSGALTPTYAQGNWNTTTPPTVQQNATAAAAAILATPANKLVSNETGQVEASNAAGLTAEQAAQLAALPTSAQVAAALAGQTLNVSSPLRQDGSVELVEGSDYTGNNALVFTLANYTGPSLTSATASMAVQLRSTYDLGTGTPADTFAGTVSTATVDGEVTVTVTVPITATETDALATTPPADPYSYVYEVRLVTSDAKPSTRWLGALNVVRKAHA